MVIYSKIIKKFLFLTLLYFYALLASGAEINDTQSWWILTGTGDFYKGKDRTNFKYWLEGQERVGNYNRGPSQRILRPGLGYALNETTSLWFGTAWIYTGTQVTRAAFSEKRIWQQILWVKKYLQLTLTSRTRLEQRFIEGNSNTDWRLREMLKIVSPFTKHPQFSVVGSNEVFWHQNNVQGQRNQGLDQNRFFMGIGYIINPTISAEIGYLNQYIHRRGGTNFLSNNISTTMLFNFG